MKIHEGREWQSNTKPFQIVNNFKERLNSILSPTQAVISIEVRLATIWISSGPAKAGPKLGVIFVVVSSLVYELQLIKL